MDTVYVDVRLPNGQVYEWVKRIRSSRIPFVFVDIDKYGRKAMLGSCDMVSASRIMARYKHDVDTNICLIVRRSDETLVRLMM